MMHPVAPIDRFVSIEPKIVPADSRRTITLMPRCGHRMLDPAKTYAVRQYPVHRLGADGSYPEVPEQRLRMEQGSLRIAAFFPGEQEHILELTPVDPTAEAGASRAGASQADDGGAAGPAIIVHIYSLRLDLFACLPWRGDLHLHSHYSDGKESPAFIACECRRIGLDFMALTDHHRFAPSLEAAAAFASAPPDMLILPGEEVHPPDNPVHTVHVGGRRSINDLFQNERAAYDREVAELEREIPASDPVARRQCASTRWVYRRIREEGGFSVFCHPYWRVRRGYDVSTAVTDWIFAQGEYDALELFGGYHRFEEDSNTLQAARYYAEAGAGRQLAIVGNSDSHGCDGSDLFGFFQSLVFAPRLDFVQIADAVRECRSVAVEALPGECVRAVGPFRMVEYALFLLRHVLPLHDELCAEEALWMLRHIEGDPKAADMLAYFRGRVCALYDQLWSGT